MRKGGKNVIRKNARKPQQAPSHPWFARRSYGYGWTPVSKEGWTAVALHIALILLWADLFIRGKTDDPYGMFWFFTIVMLQTGALMWLSWWKGDR